MLTAPVGAILGEDRMIEPLKPRHNRPCNSCSGAGWIAINRDGDPRQPDVQRCDVCGRWRTDGEARAALYEAWFAFEKARRAAL